MDDRDLATLGRFDQLPVGARAQVGDVSLFVAIAGEQLVVDLRAFIAG